MAIQTTQSTSQILAAKAAENRLAAEQAQLVVPEQSTQSGSNPYSLISSGLQGATNALTASDRRAIEQSNLDRANQIRLGQQEYERNRNTATDNRLNRTTEANISNQLFNQNIANKQESRLSKVAESNLTNNAINQKIAKAEELRAQESNADRKSDRTARIEGHKAQIDLGNQLTDIDKQQAIEFSEFSKLNGVDLLDSGRLQEYSEIDKLNADIKKGTTKNAVLEAAKLNPVLKEEGAFSKFSTDIKDILKRARAAVEAEDKSKWLPQYEEHLKASIIAEAAVDSGWLGIDGDVLDEDYLAEQFTANMLKISKAIMNKKNYDRIAKKYDTKRNTATLKAQARAIPKS